jgi:tripartite ATP-independent transporter DctM subunit
VSLPLWLLILFGTVLGMPIYAAIGGLALLLFWGEGTPIAAVPGEAYRMSTSPMLPAIPLFTLAGYILAEGGASKRLLRFFSALVGWMPGGLAIVVTLVLAFFTPLTGASGITILAMGGLLLPMLVGARYSERNGLGLVTVSGSIGVLFPPSLPVILYAYYAELDLDALFIAGFLPGVLLVVAVAAWAAWTGTRGGATRTAFDGWELLQASWGAKWEVALPAVILFSIFGGYTTLVEASAITVLYAFVVECLLFRELRWREVVKVTIESATLIGGFMVILSVALGLTNYFIIAQIPMQVLEWVQEIISSPYVFLLTLNVLLIIVGALMDIYSAIIVLVPLIAPMASAYGIHPVHLGIVFLANMQLGYLMPPMGENLFLSAYRFDRSLPEIYGCVLPYVGILLIAVLVITYVPALTLWLLGVIGGAG